MDSADNRYRGRRSVATSAEDARARRLALPPGAEKTRQDSMQACDAERISALLWRYANSHRYGTTKEVNSWRGCLRHMLASDERVEAALEELGKELHECSRLNKALCAILSNKPGRAGGAGGASGPLFWRARVTSGRRGIR